MSLSIGQATNYINNIENGKTMPSVQGLFYICEYLKIPLSDFFDEGNQYPALLKQVVEKLKPLNDKALDAILVFVSELTGKR